jgi:hypothetical protein
VLGRDLERDGWSGNRIDRHAAPKARIRVGYSYTHAGRKRKGWIEPNASDHDARSGDPGHRALLDSRFRGNDDRTPMQSLLNE